ncbi:hypothetical protein L7F22_068953 [Adiantum nelumboides]|nr:hypothetical protein [Adiantum nelumboides]
MSDVVDGKEDHNFDFELVQEHVLKSKIEIEERQYSIAKNLTEQIGLCPDLNENGSDKILNENIQQVNCQEEVFQEYEGPLEQPRMLEMLDDGLSSLMDVFFEFNAGQVVVKPNILFFEDMCFGADVVDSWLETAELVSFRFRTGYWLVGLVTGPGLSLVQIQDWSGSLVSFRTGPLVRDSSFQDRTGYWLAFWFCGQCRKIRIERAKAIQKERRRIEADQKAQKEAEAAQAEQAQETEVVDLSGTIEYLKKLEREKHTVEQRAAQLAREKIKEALSRKAEEPVLKPTQGSPKRPRQEEEEEIEHIQADHIPPSPINIPLAPPSSPITLFPPASTPQTPPSPSPLDIPISPIASTSPQQQHFFAKPIEVQTLQEETAQPMDKAEEEVQKDEEQQKQAEIILPTPIIQLEEPSKEEAIQEVKTFDYTRLIQTLSRQFQCQQVVTKETELQKDRVNKAQEEITNLGTALKLVTKERDSSARENENLLRDLIDLQSQLTRKEAQNHELIKNEKKMKEEIKYEDARF